MGTCLCADQDDHSLSALLPRGIQPRRAAQDRNGQIADSARWAVVSMTALSVYRLSGYARVWRRLAGGPAGLDLPSASEKALRDLRRRGPAPAGGAVRDRRQAAGPAAQARVRFAGLRTVVFDGCNSVKIPDTGRSWSWVGKVRSAKFTDRVAVRLVPGQAAADFAARSENLAHGFGAVLCRVRSARPGWPSGCRCGSCCASLSNCSAVAHRRT
jgi:hypothetical protein